MNKGFVALDELLIPDKQLPEAVEPGMCRLHDPPSILRRSSSSALLSCDPGHVTSGPDLLPNGFPVIPLIRIQEALPFVRNGNDNCVEHSNKLTDVMSIRSGNDQRQRDATAVHQEMALASPFFPDLWDSVRSLPVPGVL